MQKGSLYAFKGLAGRLGPIGVHAALLLVLGGTSYSGFGGYKGSVMTPEVRGEGSPASLSVSPIVISSWMMHIQAPLTSPPQAAWFRTILLSLLMQ